MNYCGLNLCDMVNTDHGIHVSLFVSGCSLHCKGCFNQEAWNKEYGKKYTNEIKQLILTKLESPYIKGFSILGGDPLEDYNYPEVLGLIKAIKDKFKSTKRVWLWTGRTFEWVYENRGELLSVVDVIVVNPFIEKKKVERKLYGSSNQKVIRLYRNSGEVERYLRADPFEAGTL